MKVIKGGVTAPKGFKANGIGCGIRAGKPDLALIYSPVTCRAAGLFTVNRVQAAPVVVSRRHIRGGRIRAIVANSGCANCCTGKEGERKALTMASVVARGLGIKAEEVLPASTGRIGTRLEIEKIRRAIPRLVSGLSAEGSGKCSRAIMTTDTVSKEAAVRLRIGGKQVTIGGIAKGAGMISPHLATMFAFFTTDADITPVALKAALKGAADLSFNRITVDGDMSTNDSVFILANALAGNRRIGKNNTGFKQFCRALETVASVLAGMIVRDGEGASRFIEVEVKGARTVKEAERAARKVAESNLVKCAFFGGDPNWGRIAAGVGAAGVNFHTRGLKIYFAGKQVLKGGAAVKTKKDVLLRLAKRGTIKIVIDLGCGRSSGTIWTCDLSTEYVRINAKY